MSLPRQNRLKSSRDFNRVHRKGQRTATKHLAIRAFRVRATKLDATKPNTTRRPLKPIKLKPIKLREKPQIKRSKAIGQVRGADDSPSAPLTHENLDRQSLNYERYSEQCSGPQFGISISRKVSKKAVVRNRIKRQLRAVIHRYLSVIDPCWQVVIVVRPAAVECSFDDFLRELDYLLKKLEIVT